MIIFNRFLFAGCGHCTQMKGAYSEAAQRLANENIGKLVAVDATVSKTISARFSINGFPTLKYFENGQLKSDYAGKRNVDDIYNFVKAGGLQKDEL